MGSHINTRRDIQVILDGIRYLVRRLRESSRTEERRIGLTAAQLFVLQHLRATDDLSINGLATRAAGHYHSRTRGDGRSGMRRKPHNPTSFTRYSGSLTERGANSRER